MAAIPNATTTTIIDPAIATEVINQIFRVAVQTPFLWEGIAEINPLSGSLVLSCPIWGALTAAPAYSTETDDVASQAVTPSAANITVGDFATGTFLSEKAQLSSAQQPMLAVAVERVSNAVKHAMDKSVLDLAASFSNSQGTNATVNTVDNLISAKTAFMALSKYSAEAPVCVMHPDAQRDLLADGWSSSSSMLGGSFGSALMMGVDTLSQGVFYSGAGMRIAFSDRIPAGDTTGWSNFIAHAGPSGSAIGMAILKPLSLKSESRAEKVGTWIVGSACYGAGIIDQNRGYKFITRT